MSLAGLLDADLDRYIAENRGGDRCWFFVHIPKTAGSSFRRELVEVLSPNYNVHVDHDKRQVSYPLKVIDATKAFNERLKAGPCRFASGHVPIATLTAHVDDWSELKLITMLRDPVKRVISDYRYQTTPSHPSHGQFIKNFPTLEAYIQVDRARNKMFRFLRPSVSASLEECKQFVVDRFSFVGIVELYPFSLSLLTSLMDQERAPSQHLRRTVETEHNRIEITPEILKRVRDLNQLDVELYRYFSSRIKPLQHMRSGRSPTRCDA